MESRGEEENREEAEEENEEEEQEHSEREGKDDEETYQEEDKKQKKCPVCGKNYSRANLGRHIKSMHGENPREKEQEHSEEAKEMPFMW